jgi:hypothetical protein
VKLDVDVEGEQQGGGGGGGGDKKFRTYFLDLMFQPADH